MSEPISLTAALASFAELWSPRIVTRVNDYDVRIAKVRGEHKPSSASGASILMVEPSGTLTVGDRHEDVPGHVDATTGHAL
ncbi:cupin domain-containing protein [Actinoplanes sp. RD1]|uniref:hypothetical protein n=1 Tax=Actinoplanes sp. RD1 TaxID=3064538 RepID=UPI0027411608|nr:hypothetical protein [Actinoplanes sp. RD1]